MRILHLSATYGSRGGGVARHVRHLAHSQIALKNFRRVLVVSQVRDGEQTKSPNQNARLREWLLKSSAKPDFYGRRAPLQRILQFVLREWNELQPSIIHAHDWESAYIALMLKEAHGTPSVMTVHRAPARWKHQGHLESPKDLFMQFVLQQELLDGLVVPSEASKDVLVEQGFPEELVHVIWHGLSYKRLRSFATDPALVRDLGLDGEGPTILCPVRDDVHKSPEVFVDAAKHILDSPHGENAKFVLTCPDDSKIAKRAEDLGLKRHFTFRVFTEVQMATLYRGASVCVVPSRRESFGQTVLEAMAYDCPVVAANAAALAEIVTHTSNGLHFTLGDDNDLAEQVLTLLKRPGMRKTLTKNARKFLKASCNSKKMATSYSDLYESLAL